MPANRHGQAGRGDPAGDTADYSDEEREFLTAMEKTRTRLWRTSRRLPTFVDVLAVAKALGYRRLGTAACAAHDRTHGVEIVGTSTSTKGKKPKR